MSSRTRQQSLPGDFLARARTSESDPRAQYSMMMEASGSCTDAARTVTIWGCRLAVMAVTSLLMASTTSPLIFLGSSTFTATVLPLHEALRTVENPPRPMAMDDSYLSVLTCETDCHSASM